MASLIFRCPVSPDVCPTSPSRGFCPNHLYATLKADRGTTAPAGEPAGGAKSGPEPQPEPEMAPTAGAEPPAQAAARTVPLVAVRLLGHLLVVSAAGLELGRDAPACCHLPGMADVLDVSRNHARLFWSGSDLYVVDLGSLNGTFVDGEPVTVPAPIRPGSRFRVADMEVELVQLDESGIPL